MVVVSFEPTDKCIRSIDLWIELAGTTVCYQNRQKVDSTTTPAGSDRSIDFIYSLHQNRNRQKRNHTHTHTPYIMPFYRSTMTMQTFKIYVYTEGGYRKIPSRADNRSENVCRELCKALNFKPISNLLFALRIRSTHPSTNHYLSVRQEVIVDAKYELRLRHQIPDLNELYKMDTAAFNYFYQQTKFDLTNGHIKDLEYPTHKNAMAGLAFTSMLTAILERDVSVEKALNQLRDNNNYKQHVPSKLIAHHGFQLKRILFAKLSDWDHTKRDAS